eukprot:Em0207g5a
MTTLGHNPLCLCVVVGWIRSAVQLAPSAFLASAAASSGLAHLILPQICSKYATAPAQLCDEALAAWSQVAIETSGVFGPKTTEFLKELGHRLRQVSGEANSFAYLTQRLSVAVHVAMQLLCLGTLKMDSEEKSF